MRFLRLRTDRLRSQRAWRVRNPARGAPALPWVYAAAAVIIALAGPAAASGQEGRREVDAGNRLYEEGRYQEAHARYLEALQRVPGLSLARFNEGNALYQSQEFQRAMEAFVDAAEGADPEWRSQAWYNLGNALLRQQQAGPAVEAYKQALRSDPEDQDAKHNLELALQQLEQQQQQQDGENQEGDEQNQDQQGEGGGQDQQPQSGEEGEQENDPSEGEDGQQQPQPQDGQPDGESPPQDQQDGEGQSEMPPPQMTPEQAERLLQAITEDPGEVNRKAAQPRGRRPRKDW